MHNGSHSDDSLLCFATLGIVTIAQELIAIVAADIEGVDIDRLAEETLTLISTASARAVDVGCGPEQGLATSRALLRVPMLYREYILASSLLSDSGATDASHPAILDRLTRAAEFYTAHMPAGVFPGERMLRDKLPLWMGRVSQPGLGETPDSRVDRLGLVLPVLTHLKVLLAFSRGRTSTASEQAGE